MKNNTSTLIRKDTPLQDNFEALKKQIESEELLEQPKRKEELLPKKPSELETTLPPTPFNTPETKLFPNKPSAPQSQFTRLFSRGASGNFDDKPDTSKANLETQKKAAKTCITM